MFDNIAKMDKMKEDYDALLIKENEWKKDAIALAKIIEDSAFLSPSQKAWIINETLLSHQFLLNKEKNE
jgi:hypothetical protein